MYVVLEVFPSVSWNDQNFKSSGLRTNHLDQRFWPGGLNKPFLACCVGWVMRTKNCFVSLGSWGIRVGMAKHWPLSSRVPGARASAWMNIQECTVLSVQRGPKSANQYLLLTSFWMLTFSWAFCGTEHIHTTPRRCKGILQGISRELQRNFDETSDICSTFSAVRPSWHLQHFSVMWR